MIRTAVIMARGLGTRMRRTDDAAALNAEQAAVAATGAKGMIPIGRPFLEYVISALADAGITRVVLVVAPGDDAIRRHFTTIAPPHRVQVDFAEQPEPIGTADAVVCAAAVVGREAFLVLNADNYYPVAAYKALAAEASAGVVAFDRDALVREGNIDVDRVRAYAVLDIARDDGADVDGDVRASGEASPVAGTGEYFGTDAGAPAAWLRGIIEKPGATLDPDSPAARWVGMNLWAVTPSIVEACRRVPRSQRGEYELPEAVALALAEGVKVRAVCMSAAVLDLSQRRDIATVAQHLRGVVVVL